MKNKLAVRCLRMAMNALVFDERPDSLWRHADHGFELCGVQTVAGTYKYLHGPPENSRWSCGIGNREWVLLHTYEYKKPKARHPPGPAKRASLRPYAYRLITVLRTLTADRGNLSTITLLPPERTVSLYFAGMINVLYIRSTTA